MKRHGYDPRSKLDRDSLDPYIMRPELPKLAVATGLEVLGCGVGRVVFLICKNDELTGDQGLVLKIPYNSFGWEANVTEGRAWKRVTGLLRKFLVPVVDYSSDGAWLTMEYADDDWRHRLGKSRDYQAVRDAARVLMDRSDNTTGLISAYVDMQSHNWGTHDGTLKLLDYGM